MLTKTKMCKNGNCCSHPDGPNLDIKWFKERRTECRVCLSVRTSKTGRSDLLNSILLDKGMKKCSSKEKCCNKNGPILSLDDFGKDKSNPSGVKSRCKECENKIQKENYRRNKKNIIERAKKYRAENKEKISKQRKNNRLKNYEKILEKEKRWREENRELYRKRARDSYYRCREKNRLNENMSSAVYRSLFVNKTSKNRNPWQKIVGYTENELKQHLEGLFTEGMTWDNYGKNGWHIDHIIPLSLWEFDSYEHQEFKQCWSLANLQPLWWRENIIKGNRV